MPKPTRSALQLQQLIQARIDQMPATDGLPAATLHGTVVWKDAQFGGANWTVRSGREPESYRVDVARIIRQVQTEFDLDVD